MARREVFESRGLRIETTIDWNGRYYIAYRPQCSMYFRDRRDLMKWCGYPVKTPTRDSLMSWLDSLQAADEARHGPVSEPLGDANVEGSWDPQAHDVDNDATRMIT